MMTLTSTWQNLNVQSQCWAAKAASKQNWLEYPKKVEWLRHWPPLRESESDEYSNIFLKSPANLSAERTFGRSNRIGERRKVCAPFRRPRTRPAVDVANREASGAAPKRAAAIARRPSRRRKVIRFGVEMAGAWGVYRNVFCLRSGPADTSSRSDPVLIRGQSKSKLPVPVDKVITVVMSRN